MAETDPPIVQSTGNAHYQIGESFLGIAQNIFHNPTAFDARNHVFHADPHAGNQAVEKQISDTQGFAFRFLLGLERENAQWRIALKSGILIENGVWRILDRFRVRDFLVVGFAAVRLAEIVHALSVFVDENYVFVRVRLFLPLYASRCFSGFFGRWRRRSVPSMIKSVGTSGVTPVVANATASRSGICFNRTKLRSKMGSNR